MSLPKLTELGIVGNPFQKRIEEILEITKTTSFSIVQFSIQPILEKERTRLLIAMSRDKTIMFIGSLISLLMVILSPILILLIIPSIGFGYYSYRSHQEELNRISYSIRLIREETEPHRNLK